MIEATGCGIVLISAWRYMILNGAMTLRGFDYLLRTHRLRVVGKLVGRTRKDYDIEDKAERGRQVREWLAEHLEVTRWAAPSNVREIIEQVEVSEDIHGTCRAQAALSGRAAP